MTPSDKKRRCLHSEQLQSVRGFYPGQFPVPILSLSVCPDILRRVFRLLSAVCSPGGSTIVGVATLEDSAFRAAAANAVFNANEKNKSLGK